MREVFGYTPPTLVPPNEYWRDCKADAHETLDHWGGARAFQPAYTKQGVTYCINAFLPVQSRDEAIAKAQSYITERLT